MSEFKYVMFTVTLPGSDITYELPVIFPDKLVHEHVARAMIGTLRMTFPKGSVSVVSAGTAENLDVTATTGRSETLRLNSRPDDAKVINSFPYAHGVKT